MRPNRLRYVGLLSCTTGAPWRSPLLTMTFTEYFAKEVSVFGNFMKGKGEGASSVALNSLRCVRISSLTFSRYLITFSWSLYLLPMASMRGPTRSRATILSSLVNMSLTIFSASRRILPTSLSFSWKRRPVSSIFFRVFSSRASNSSLVKGSPFSLTGAMSTPVGGPLDGKTSLSCLYIKPGEIF